MESAGLRSRNRSSTSVPLEFENLNTEGASVSIVPRYKIDLSLPPVERYQKVAAAFKHELIALPQLFDDVVRGLHPHVSVQTVHHAARLLLRRLNSSEETEELRGVQKVTGIEMYLLVAFNTLLDLFSESLLLSAPFPSCELSHEAPIALAGLIILNGCALSRPMHLRFHAEN